MKNHRMLGSQRWWSAQRKEAGLPGVPPFVAAARRKRVGHRREPEAHSRGRAPYEETSSDGGYSRRPEKSCRM
jgi:hypothetical protein